MLGFNSLFAWYQVELRGRSQHGEGVLKVKLPDYRGIQLANPATISPARKDAVLAAFSELSGVGAGPSLEELGSSQRLAFDLAYLRACGFPRPQEIVVLLEQELRALAGERVERKLSVADVKISRRKATKVAASVDAYAARIVASMSPFPDPRTFIDADDDFIDVAITGLVDGPLAVGIELFDVGEVTSGGKCIARADNVTAAHIVRAILLIDPNTSIVKVPKGAGLQKMHKEWQAAIKRWRVELLKVSEQVLAGVSDLRRRDAVNARALSLTHAS
jgi:hypothetical protein